MFKKHNNIANLARESFLKFRRFSPLVIPGGPWADRATCLTLRAAIPVQAQSTPHLI